MLELNMKPAVASLDDKRFLALAHASAMIVWITDSDGMMTRENKTWTEYTGQNYEQYRQNGEFNALHPEDRDRAYQLWNKAVNLGVTYEMEVRIRRYDGEYYYFLCKGVPVRGNDNKIEEWVGTATDITERKLKEARIQEAYEREHSIAQALQQALLLKPPSNLFPGFDIGMLYEAASHDSSVGGDFFDCFHLDGKYAFVVGDVSGKGLIAATRTAEIKYALRAMLYNNARPDEVLEKLNNFYIDTHDFHDKHNGTFVVLSLLVLDPKNGEGWFAKAGAEPPLMITKEGRQRSLGAGGLPIGILANEKFEQMNVKINPGDMISMFTDGLTEAKKPNNRMFGYEGMKRLFRVYCLTGPIEDCGRSIVDAVRAWAGQPFKDDVCMLMVRRNKDYNK